MLKKTLAAAGMLFACASSANATITIDFHTAAFTDEFVAPWIEITRRLRIVAPDDDAGKTISFSNGKLTGTLYFDASSLILSVPNSFYYSIGFTPPDLLEGTGKTNPSFVTIEGREILGDSTVAGYVTLMNAYHWRGEVPGVTVTLGNYWARVVPEPSSWALMLIGFGFVGSAMRARRRTSVVFG